MNGTDMNEHLYLDYLLTTDSLKADFVFPLIHFPFSSDS